MLTRVPTPGDGFFSGIVPQEVMFPSEGQDVVFELPQRYYKWSLMLGHFPASAAAIRPLLPQGSGLEPVTIAPGLGIVTIGAFRYERCATLRPYDEVGVMFPVRLRPALSLPALPLFRPEWFSDLGFYVWQLPVTTVESRDAGRTFWNYPKRVGRIAFSEDQKQRRRRCSWTQDGAHVLTLEVRTSNTSRQLRNFLTYSVLRGRLQQTLVQTYGDSDESRFGLDATFSLGDHPIADEMRQLGIIDTAIGRLYSSEVQGILPGPSAVPFTKVPAPLRAPQILKSILARSAPKRPGPKVAVLGGGVAGLSAAHELVERGFDVTVYERREIAGGKARSSGVPGSSGALHEDLPCEHGFRFFPGFYRHLPDTMARIPYTPTGKTVVDNLVATSRVAIDFRGDQQLVFPARFPSSLADFGTLIAAAGLIQERTGCTAEEISFYISKIWQLLTSCEERRLEQYEQIPWWDFIKADAHSLNYQNYLGSTTRSLVAADPRKASTRTVGNILLQMLFDFGTPGVSVDRVLNGPTNEVWIDPWVEHLEKSGVTWRCATVRKLLVRDGRLDGVRVADELDDGRVVNERTVRADYYVAAVPVEVMAKLLEASPEVTDADPNLKTIIDLSQDVESMTGIQFYFRERLPLEPGHYMHLDSQWALTSLAQAQFWTTDLKRFGDGTIRDILSVDISDWNTASFNGKTANNCTRAEIKEEVWKQLQHSLPFLQSMEPVTVYLDEAIVEENGRVSNVEPLLVNKAKHWNLRPEAITRIPNLFLASDYVRTYTDLATMEGANEAARRAVNGILDATRSVATPCAIWNLHEPVILSPLRWIDRYRYYRGLDWSSDVPLAFRGLQTALSLTNTAAVAAGRVLAPIGVARPIVPEDESPDFAVPLEIQDQIGDRIQEFIDEMRRGDARGLLRLFIAYATITIGLRPRAVEEAVPFIRPGVIVSIEQIKSVYQLGSRVHLRMTVSLNEDGRVGPDVEGHVHVVFVKTEEAGWLIASLRYRREGQPAQLEPLSVP
jgi:15-cis-phytoene desaturase